jgi:transcriptional regulator with XRE-family HTH domain
MAEKERILELRKVLKLKQYEFADKLGIKRTVLSNIETGHNGITDANIRLICMTFNVNEAWLRGGIGAMFIEEAGLTLQEQELIDIYRRLESINQNLVIDHSRALLKSQNALLRKDNEKKEIAVSSQSHLKQETRQKDALSNDEGYSQEREEKVG